MVAEKKFDVVVVGAGFGGMYMLHKLLGLGFNATIVEAASGVGGTWWWNRYPGARCDVESLEYSYSFSDDLQQEWEWSQKFSEGPEILEYANHVADRFGLREHINFNTKINSVTYDDSNHIWTLKSLNGDVYKSNYCVMATGTLSDPNEPKFNGLHDYQGDWYLTGKWPHEGVDFQGKTVGIIGTGSSAVQAIPVIAKDAKHLTVFQRTANYSIPANQQVLPPEEVAEVKANYSEIRQQARQDQAGIGRRARAEVNIFEVSPEEREAEFQKRWDKGGTGFTAAYKDILETDEANAIAAEFVKRQIKKIVKDPKVAELLCPTNTIGCKRLCADTEYFETYNRDNVNLIDINSNPIEGLYEKGIKTQDQNFEFDIVIFAIGFDAMTGALKAMNIVGKNGVELNKKWEEGPVTYLGLSVSGFPNLFTITGPGSPSVLSNMITSIEQHVEWIAGCISYMHENQKVEIDADIQSEEDWGEHVEEVASATLRYGCNSWYVGANVPGKRRIFMPYAGGIPKYNEKCEEVSNNGYKGYTLV